MKKIISILACVCLLLSVVIVPVFAAETTTTITFDDKAKRTEFDTSHQVWVENGITVTNNKAASTSNVADYANPGRFYKSSEVIIEYPSMTKIVIDHTGLAAKYVGWADSFNDANASAVADANTTTITFATPVDSFKFDSMSVQSRAYSITVYAIAGEDACTHSETTATSNGDETHTIVCAGCGETLSTSACVDSDKDGACDTCTGAVELPFDPTGKTAAEIVDAAYALGVGESFETNATLTGVITAVNTAYNSQYGNVTVTIAIEGKEDKPIECYRLAGEGADTITVDDKITVTGILKNYNGKIEFDQGCTLDAVEKGDLVIVVPDDPKEIVDEAFALEAGASLLYEATLEGVIVEINEPYSEEFKNMQVTIEVEGTTGVHNLLCYRMKAAEGEDAAALKVGDKIAVTGTIKNYNGTIEYDTGCTFVLVEAYVEEPVLGSYENPYEVAVSEGRPLTVTTITVPAGEAVYVKPADLFGKFIVLQADCAYNLINGAGNQTTGDPEADYYAELDLVGLDFVVINNAGEADITVYVALVEGAAATVGTWDNPEVLEFMENPYMPQFPPSAEAQTELEAGNQGYFYKVVAPKDCILVVNVSAVDAEWNNVGYQYNITNNTTSWQSDFIARGPEAEDFYDSLFVEVKAGDELLISAGTYNPEDVWNAPAGTLNVRINTTTVGSSDYPEILTETGTYTATVEAGSQGYYYEYTAEADGIVTVTMNDAAWTYTVNNLTSYVYGDTQWSDSDPVVPSYEVEVAAGDLISIQVNTYDAANPWEAPAGTVNWTLSWSEKVATPVVFSIDDVEAAIGEEFQVVVNLSENPGLIAATLGINYDADVLELVSATAGDLTNNSIEADDVTLYNYSFGPAANNPFIITWVDALAEENITTNGVFVTLTFKVKDAAVAGTTDITITANADDIYDKDFNNVEFTLDGATVTVVDNAVPGDTNGDGNINVKDYALLIQYLNGWEIEIDQDAADVNNDGNINVKDYALLIQYLNGWDVELV